MRQGTLGADLLLLATATIWGFAFVAQRLGMEHVGPFTFNGVRFALGSIALLPVIALLGRRQPPPAAIRVPLYRGALAAGIALFAGASLQQVGLLYTTAGNAGFITGLYVVLVPIIGMLWRQCPPLGTWAGALLATAGLYLLSVTSSFTIGAGDLLVLVGACFWALHVLVIGYLAPRTNTIQLACAQFAVCAILSLATAAVVETITISHLLQAAAPILYGGLASVGVAYTLQVIAQRRAHPAHAAIIMSMEGVFAALGGWWLLQETMSTRGLCGGALMLCGMILSQLAVFASRHRQPPPGDDRLPSH